MLLAAARPLTLKRPNPPPTFPTPPAGKVLSVTHNGNLVHGQSEQGAGSEEDMDGDMSGDSDCEPEGSRWCVWVIRKDIVVDAFKMRPQWKYTVGSITMAPTAAPSGDMSSCGSHSELSQVVATVNGTLAAFALDPVGNTKSIAWTKQLLSSPVSAHLLSAGMFPFLCRSMLCPPACGPLFSVCLAAAGAKSVPHYIT